MKQVWQTADGRIFDTEKSACRWENSDNFAIHQLKQEFTTLSVQQYRDKRSISHIGQDYRITKNGYLLPIMSEVQSRVARRSAKLTAIQRKMRDLKLGRR